MSEQDKSALFILRKEYTNLKLSAEQNSQTHLSINQEHAIVNRIYEELEWNSMPDDIKNEKRKASLMMLDKWAHEEGAPQLLTYEHSVVVLYDSIENYLSKSVPDNPYLVRIKSIILIEKIFINEKRDFSTMRHMDYYIWKNLFEDTENNISNLYISLDLHTLNECFTRMYSSWPKRPYKEV